MRWLSGAGRILLGESGEPVRGVGISMDVTETPHIGAAFSAGAEDGSHRTAGRRRGARLQQSVDGDSGVLCDQLLRRTSSLDDPRQADITEIQKAGMRAAGLTRQLLAFSRKQIIEPTRLDLNVVVTDMQAMLRRLIGKEVNDWCWASTRVGAPDGRPR